MRPLTAKEMIARYGVMPFSIEPVSGVVGAALRWLGFRPGWQFVQHWPTEWPTVED